MNEVSARKGYFRLHQKNVDIGSRKIKMLKHHLRSISLICVQRKYPLIRYLLGGRVIDSLLYTSNTYCYVDMIASQGRFQQEILSFDVLCVSCPSATEFLAIVFLLFARSSSNSPRSFLRFRQTLVLNFIQIRLRVNNFPMDPHCEKWSLSATL